jgi:hypothetical protein
VIEESDLENDVPGTGKQLSSATVARFFKIFRSSYFLIKINFNNVICPLCRDLVTEELLAQNESSCFKIGHDHAYAAQKVVLIS